MHCIITKGLPSQLALVSLNFGMDMPGGSKSVSSSYAAHTHASLTFEDIAACCHNAGHHALPVATLILGLAQKIGQSVVIQDAIDHLQPNIQNILPSSYPAFLLTTPFSVR
jgi:hypothetical protein